MIKKKTTFEIIIIVVAEFERAVKSTNKLESMLKDINQTNELSK